MKNKHRELKGKAADVMATIVGSWSFTLGLSGIIIGWMLYNTSGFQHFDAFPFIFLNLFLSALAAIATPIILMSQNRAAELDRERTKADLECDLKAAERIEELHEKLEALDAHVRLRRLL